jgi:hypothetical protein
VAEAVLPGAGRPGQGWLAASPFLVFAVAVQRSVAGLARTNYLPEWTGPHQRVPVFADPELRAFAADPWRQLFLAELLASFAHVSSGVYRAVTPRGPRRRRWNELDPVRLAGLLDVVPPAEAAGVYRRLGDLALFLTGVFPDHTALHGLSGIDAARLRRAAGLPPASADALAGGGTVALLGELGTRWYRIAVRRAGAHTRDGAVLAGVAAQFAVARRLLGLVTERYLYPAARDWFPDPFRH